MTPERQYEIQALAEEVHEEFFGSGQCNPLVVLEHNSITHTFGRYEDAFDGMLECIDGEFHVYCNLDRLERPDTPRAKFTLGHELGHYYIDEHRHALLSGRALAHPSKCEYQSSLEIEREADLFASRLLMPTQLFNRVARSCGLGMAAVLGLSRKFGTSITSTAIRYRDAGLQPCIVLKWDTSGLCWKWGSDDACQLKLNSVIRKVDQLPEGSATKNALEGAATPACGYFQSGSTVESWFRAVRGYDSRNAVLVEQAIALGRYGVLTILYPESGEFLF